MYFLLTENSYYWVTCPWKIEKPTLNNDEMPPGNTKQFYLLKPLGKGIESLVWLACSRSLKVCAIKFYRKSILKRNEAEMWKKLGFTGSRCITLQSRVCLIMPYVKPCSHIIFNNDFYEMAKKSNSGFVQDEFVSHGHKN